MKRVVLYIFILIASINVLFGQSVSLKQVVLPTQGAHYRVGNTALSWTLGEPTHCTISNSGKVLTQGVQQIERPLAMDSIPSKRVCSDTTEQIVFGNVLAGKWANHVEWSTNSSFEGSQIIRSKDSIILTVDSGMIDTIWLRSSVGYRGPKGSVTKTHASVLPNISVANKITIVNDLCGMIDTIHLVGPTHIGGYTYQWQNSNDEGVFIGIDNATNADYYLTPQYYAGWFRRLLCLPSYCEKVSNKIRIQ